MGAFGGEDAAHGRAIGTIVRCLRTWVQWHLKHLKHSLQQLPAAQLVRLRSRRARAMDPESIRRMSSSCQQDLLLVCTDELRWYGSTYGTRLVRVARSMYR